MVDMAFKGHIPWNKGAKGLTVAWNKGLKNSEETKRKISENTKIALRKRIAAGLPVGLQKGNIVSMETRRKISATLKGRPSTNLGRKASDETRLKMRNAQLLRVAEGRHNTFHGKSSEYQLIRESLDYRLWRESVFKRDNYTCQECGERGGKLNADHIKSFAEYPESRFEVSNGRTLCEECHKKTDTFLGNFWKGRKRTGLRGKAVQAKRGAILQEVKSNAGTSW